MSAIAVGIGAGVSAAASVASVALAATKKPPKAAQFTPINLQAEQAGTISGNLASFGQASELASRTNTFNASEIERMNELSMPGYGAMKTKGTANIMEMLRGEIPQDLQTMLATQGASRASAGGFGGTGMAKNLTARDFGLTSLGIKQQGMDSATRWMSMNRAPVFDVSSMFLRPGETAEFKSRQNIEQRDYTNQANLYNYASDPETEWRNQIAGLAGQVGGAMVNYLGTGLTKQIGASGGPGATPYTDALLGTSAGYGGNIGG